jgi:hypothetical protein
MPGSEPGVAGEGVADDKGVAEAGEDEGSSLVVEVDGRERTRPPPPKYTSLQSLKSRTLHDGHNTYKNNNTINVYNLVFLYGLFDL